ncbi:MAG: L-aspartate oxidase [Leptospirales bacterium]
MHCDVLVIGSGIAGLYFSLLASKLNKDSKITIVTKDKVTEGATRFAQGGVAASLSPSDSPEKHLMDTLEAGAGLCDSEAVRVLVYEGVDRIKELINMGMEFTKNPLGELDLGMEGGHTEKRIVHAKDHTGSDLHQFLLNQVQQNSNITILENHFAIDIITEHHLPTPSKPQKAFGAYVINEKTQNIETIQAKSTCLATGGAGRVYRYTTNPRVSTGDGIAMGYRAGCRVRNMEFIQFHPTALYSDRDQSFLISEAVRGSGAFLLLKNGERFLYDYDPRAELAPRDVVARAIDSELKKSGDECVFLDVTHLGAEKIQSDFPLIYKTLLTEFNIDMTKERIPVVPAAHYTCGGLWTDLDGKTDLTNLYAVGETASTGVHGANRLASNSLLESLVFTYRAVEDLKKNINSNEKTDMQLPLWNNTGAVNFDERGIMKYNRDELRKIMWNYIGITRSKNRLNRALRIIDIIYEEVRDLYNTSKLNRDILELRNMALICQLIVRSALSRHESRGLHYMSDYKENRKTSRKDTILRPSIK